MKTRPERGLLQTAQCIYSIPCGCGRTDRSLAMRLREHRHHLQKDILERSKLAQHVYEEGHRAGWDEDIGLETESNSKYRRYKKFGMLNHSNQPNQFGHFS
jgi:hypothetical protein